MIFYVPIIGFIVAIVEYLQAYNAHRRTLGGGLTAANQAAYDQTWVALDNFNVAAASTFVFLAICFIALMIVGRRYSS